MLWRSLVDSVPDTLPVADDIPPTPGPTFTPIPRDWIAPAVLSQAYESNELAANQQYQGKRLKVRGQVETARLNPSGVPYIEFVDTAPRGTYCLHDVRCQFTAGHQGFARISKGDTVTVQGLVYGLHTLDVLLTACRLV